LQVGAAIRHAAIVGIWTFLRRGLCTQVWALVFLDGWFSNRTFLKYLSMCIFFTGSFAKPPAFRTAITCSSFLYGRRLLCWHQDCYVSCTWEYITHCWLFNVG
jgi:hypothetical protein